MLLLGALNFYQARELLTDSVTDQLLNQQAAKARAIRNGLDRIEQTVILVARSDGTVDSVMEFSRAYRGLLDEPDLLDPGESAAVDQFYGSVVDAIQAAGLEAPPAGELAPGTDAGRYLQYHYIVQNPFEARERRQMVTADLDDSEYGQVHAERHPRLAELSTQLGFGDLLLVDTEGNVVYSTDKRLEFATNAEDGPYRDTGMGMAVTTRLAAAPVGDVVFVDFEIYLPAGGRPSMFVAAAVRNEARTVGAVLVEIPIEALDELTTGGGEYAGLGDTGEIYVVGTDQLLRSDSRLWLEDPDAYRAALERAGFEPELGAAVAIFDSTVLLQPVETEAVVEAFDGRLFLGRTSNYLGRKSLTVAGPVGDNQLDWVVVADLASSEADRPLRTYAGRVAIAALILIPIVGLVALFLADRMTRPVKPVVDAAAQVAGGQLEITLPDLGRNEFGDAARRLNTLTVDLRAQEQALAREEREIRDLLLSALPPRIVEQLRSGERSLHDLVDTATVIALTVTGMLDEAGIDPESAVEFAARLSSELEAVADRVGVERVRSASEQHLFVAGLDTPEAAVSKAAEFALAAATTIERFAAELGIVLTYYAGISAGEVIAGLLSVGQLTYGVFGDPARAALALNAVAGPGQILVGADTAAELGGEWEFEQASNLLDLRGEPVVAKVLKGGPM
jgi:class 3 adenylate cyclase